MALKRNLRVLTTSGSVGVDPLADQGVTRSLRRKVFAPKSLCSA